MECNQVCNYLNQIDQFYGYLENLYHHTIKSEVGHFLKDWQIQLVVIKRKRQREDLFVILGKKGRVTKSAPYPQCHLWMGTLGL